MDGLGAAASIVSLLELAQKLYDIGEAAYKSEREKSELKNKLGDLTVKLKQLKGQESYARKHPDDRRYDNIRAILYPSEQSNGKNEPNGTTKQPGILERLQSAMEETESHITPGHGYKARARRLLWYHDRKKYEGTLADIREWTATVDSILIVDTYDRVRTIEDKIDHSTRENERKALEKKRIAIVTWLSSLRFKERQSALVNQMQDRLFKPILLTSKEFEMWKAGSPWILHCQGMPGSGKTLLCAATVEHLKEVFRNAGFPILCMYLSHKQRYEQTLDNLIASLLKQLIQRQGAEFKSSVARRLYQGAENGSRPDLKELFKALQAEIRDHARVFIVVDALDEAAPNVRPGLCEKLDALASDKVSILLTSQRPEDGLRATIQIQCDECKREAVKIYSRCPICEEGSYYLCQDCIEKGVCCNNKEHKLEEQQEILVDIEPSADEMKKFVMTELEAQEKPGFSDRRDIHVSTYGTTPLGRLLKSQPGLKTVILDSVVAKANGMFALAGLYLNSLGSLGLSESEILDMLEKPPEGYFGFYEQYMERICAVGLGDPFGHGASLGRRVLSWVFCTKRPMSLVELQHALAVDLKKPGLFNLAAIYDKATIITVTAGLVTIDNNGANGNEAVRPNHLSAQQYFDENRDRWFPDVSAEIAKVALHYISLPRLAKPCDNDWEDKEFEMRRQDYPFLEYAYPFWGDHVAEAGSKSDVHTAVMQYVSDQNKVAAFIQAAWCLSSDATAEWDVRKSVNGLHVAAWFGLTLVIKDLIHQGIDVDSKDPKYGQTPLMYACRKGQTVPVRLLLEHGANVNMYSHRGSCAIHEAVNARNLDVLQVLLENDKTDVNAPHLMKYGMTALAIAAHEDYPEIAIALLQHDNVKINSKDLKGITALSHAIAVTGIEVAEWILDRQERSVDLDARDWKGSTALSLAAEKGMDDLVVKLLSKGADSSIRDDQGGGTAILRAIDGNQLSTVKIMLEHGVDINCRDDQDRGLLHGAATGGEDEMVQLLLDKGLNPDCIDKKGKAPLHDASRGGYFTTVRTLLDSGANPWLKDNTGRTPWTVAWHNGHIPVLNVLEKRYPDDIYDQSDEFPNPKELPVWSLASLGMEELVAHAIRNNKDQIWLLDPENSNTALHCAVLSNKSKIVQMLLDVRMSPDAKNDYLRTPLHLAALEGYIEIMRLLLNNDRIEEDGVNSEDKWGSPPVALAYSTGHFECCLLLIEAGATIPSSKQSEKQSLFFLAIEFGHLDAVIKLINMGADVQAKNVLGLTGIQVAQDGGKTDIEIHLRKNKSVWVNSIDSEVTTPDEIMASMTLKQSPFHRPEAWDEEEKEKADFKGPSLVGALTENNLLQQLAALNAPSNPPASSNPSKLKQRACGV